MTTIGGFVFLLAMVFGGYIIAGGKFGIILHSLPYEMMMIGGAAVGSFVMSNSMHDIKHVLGGFGKIIKGARFHKHEYSDLLALLYFFVRLAQQKGAMALEPHIEKPEDSAAFQKLVLPHFPCCGSSFRGGVST
ncbi:motility-associated protein [Belnapia rosea]|uniref:Chemotaxis protein MotA n=1 Tax=Belnapia rosea TaxID=938405 RepID=A0A1G6NR13_9PROT|nr:motility-associated protein [Belnapia rosea]SDC69707.1 chemotaxis protein MotA [Belnapia rosea]